MPACSWEDSFPSSVWHLVALSSGSWELGIAVTLLVTHPYVHTPAHSSVSLPGMQVCKTRGFLFDLSVF